MRVTDKAKLIDHVETPKQSETPLELLREKRVTSREVLYVRNNVDLDGVTMQPASAEGWRVQVGGLVEDPATLNAAELFEYPQTEVEMVLQCSGNSREKFDRAAPVAGALWQHGALADVVFGGVLLSEILEPQGDPEKLYLTARGEGTVQNGQPFERSVPLAEVLETALLATHLNGEPIPGVHGGPVRLVLPGFYGVNNVKWLTHLSVDREESRNLHQKDRYRMPLEPIEPGSAFHPTPQNSRSSWRQNVKSLLWSPLPSGRVPAGQVTLRGPAWTDGQSEISTVEVSLDQGDSWQEAAIEPASSPYSWHLWTLSVALDEGEREVWVRAKDDAGNVQPLDGTVAWNPDGYEWNGVDKVTLTVG